MTADQFAALAKLIQLRQGPSREAARLVLVEGLRPSDAAALTGLSLSGASNVVSRARRGLELVLIAAGCGREGA